MVTIDGISIKAGTNTSNDIGVYGTEIDFDYSYKYADAVLLFITLDQLSPDDGLTGGSDTPDDAVTRIYGSAWVKFGGSKKQD